MAYWSHMTQSAVPCTRLSLLFKIPYYAGALRLGSFTQWTKVARNQHNSILEIRTGFNQSGTSLSQLSPDLLRWVFVVYVPEDTDHKSGHESRHTQPYFERIQSFYKKTQQKNSFIYKKLFLFIETFHGIFISLY